MLSTGTRSARYKMSQDFLPKIELDGFEDSDPTERHNSWLRQTEQWINTADKDPESRQSLLNLVLQSPKTDEELWWWVTSVLGLELPMRAHCKNHSAPFTAFANAFFAREVMSIWKASRGFGGKSVLLSALGCAESITLGAAVSLLGGSGEQSQRIHEYMGGEHDNFPHSFWNSPLLDYFEKDIKERVSTATRTRLRNGGRVTALTASSRAVRGPHPQRLRGDEIDEMDPEIWDAAKGQPMTARGIAEQTVGSSTHQYPDGAMTIELTRARERGWAVHEWCYKESLSSMPGGWLTPTMVEKKKIIMPAIMWKTEVELQEPNPEGRAIDPEGIKKMFNANLGIYSGELGDRLIFEEPVKSEDDEKPATYGVGADWGKHHDKSIFTVWRFDVRPVRLVAFYHLGRRPWPMMIRAYQDLAKKYGGGIDMDTAAAAHDATGIGDVIHDYLEVPAEGVVMRGPTRADLIHEYIMAIEAGDLEAPMIHYMYDEHRFVTTDDLMGSGHPPDSFVGGAMGYRAGLYGFLSLFI